MYFTYCVISSLVRVQCLALSSRRVRVHAACSSAFQSCAWSFSPRTPTPVMTRLKLSSASSGDVISNVNVTIDVVHTLYDGRIVYGCAVVFAGRSWATCIRCWAELRRPPSSTTRSLNKGTCMLAQQRCVDVILACRCTCTWICTRQQR